MSGSHVQATLSLINERKNISKGITLDGTKLSVAEVLAVSLDSKLKVHISEKALEDVSANEEYLTEKLRNGLVAYGINTGFGGSAEVRSWKLRDVQKALIRHINVGMGRVFPAKLVRAAMVTRANCLVKAYSGVRPVVPSTLVELINNDISPQVPLRGSISASGDLMPLGYIAAAMIGRDDLQVTKGGIVMPCPQALQESGIIPLELGPKEGLGIVNATTFTAGLSVPTVYDANILLLLTQVCTGLSIEAMHGRTESFHPVIHNCLPHVGQQEIARNMLTVLDGSKMVITTLDMHLPDKYGVLKQDRYSVRSSPQWLGSVAETLKETCRRLTIELNSATDNPLIDHRTDTVAHCANFQGETLSIAMDQTRQVLGVCGKLLFGQFSEVVDAKLNFGLPPNLSGCDINTDFGFKGCDIAMASYMSELDHFVNPMSNHVLSAECHNQAINSMALVSARLTAEAVEILQMMVSSTLLLTVQAVDLRHIRNLVLKEIDELKQKVPEISLAIKEMKWYDLLFFSEEKAIELADGRNEQEQMIIQEHVSKRLSNLYKSACSGSIDVSDLMGKGTKRMYNFIRRELKIPFYCGQNGIDKWLDQILHAIQDRDIEDLLVETFSETKPSSKTKDSSESG